MTFRRPQMGADSNNGKRRISLLSACMLLFAAVIFLRLVQLQLVQHSRYVAMASKAHNRKYEIAPARGQIYVYDRNTKVPLVLNQTLKMVYADPAFVKDASLTAQKLSNVLKMSKQELEKQLRAKGEYVVLKKRLDPAAADKVVNLKLAGVGVANQPSRTYPEGSLGSQILGFVNAEGKGQYGVEGYMNKYLAGTPGLLSAKTDVAGVPIATADNTIIQPIAGSNVVLTIDRNIQAQAERYLKEGVEKTGAKSGSVVLVDPKNGAIKAMANYPTYDPNQFESVKDYQLFGNSSVSSLFEPGSGFKVIAMAAGLNTGAVKPDTTYDDTGAVQVSGHVIKNSANHKYGVQTMVDVIQKSLNTGVIYVLGALGGNPSKISLQGKKVFYDYIQKFGFGKITGIEQSGEAAGVVNPPTSNDVNYANMTFGQGISTTVLQMIMSVAAIANGGTLYKPYIVSEISDASGTIKKTEPTVVRKGFVKKKTAQELTHMLEQVVLHGSGWMTKIPGYRVVGKTGTAQIPKANGRGYEESKNIGTFVGYAPAQDPRFVMMVRIDEPKVSGFAESTTVPVFADIAKWLLRYWAVPPGA